MFLLLVAYMVFYLAISCIVSSESTGAAYAAWRVYIYIYIICVYSVHSNWHILLNCRLYQKYTWTHLWFISKRTETTWQFCSHYVNCNALLFMLLVICHFFQCLNQCFNSNFNEMLHIFKCLQYFLLKFDLITFLHCL